MQFDMFQSNDDPNIGDVEAWCLENGLQWIIGVDEAGRGPLAGPVYAAAVVLDFEHLEEPWVEALNDSKKLTEKQRLECAENIREHAIAYAVIAKDQTVIDEINILQATLEAMKDAVESVANQMDQTPERVFVDGKITLDIEYAQQWLIGGDGKSRAIAAASILAKTERDAYMVTLHEQWPDYGFAGHKGYPTKKHREAIAEHGPSPHHRLTFGCVAEHVDKLRPDSDAIS